MLLSQLDLLFRNPTLFLLIMAGFSISLMLGITVHEFSHALVATRLGDPTAKRLGRLSLNPLAHLDPVGTLMLFVIGFGWGKPVPVDPNYMRVPPRQGMSLVAIAGPLSNLCAAAVLALPLKLGLLAWHSPLRYASFSRTDPIWLLADLLGFVIYINVLLAVFNLIPLAPLDGSNVLQGIVPRQWLRGLLRLQMYGPGVLLAIIALGFFFHFSVFSIVLGPPISFLTELLVGRPL